MVENVLRLQIWAFVLGPLAQLRRDWKQKGFGGLPALAALIVSLMRFGLERAIQLHGKTTKSRYCVRALFSTREKYFFYCRQRPFVRKFANSPLFHLKHGRGAREKKLCPFTLGARNSVMWMWPYVYLQVLVFLDEACWFQIGVLTTVFHINSIYIMYVL